MTSALRVEHLERVAAETARPGREYCRLLAELTDDWVISIFDDALERVERPGGTVALLAIGGYGRGELAPQSDLDLLLVHDVKARKVAKGLSGRRC